MKIYGRAVVGGVPGAVTWASMGANSSVVQQSLDAAHNWTENIIRDPSSGKPLGIFVTDEAIDLTIDVIPAADGVGGNTKADAVGALSFPSPYTVVTLSGFDNTDINGTFLYIGGGTQSYTADGVVRWRLPLKRWRECSDSEIFQLGTLTS